MRSQYEQELSGLCQQLLSLQAAMLREQIRVKTVIYEKDQIISQQKQEMEKLLQTSPAIIGNPIKNVFSNHQVALVSVFKNFATCFFGHLVAKSTCQDLKN